MWSAAAAPLQAGRVSIRADRAAKVNVDGEVLGTFPADSTIRVPGLGPGRHKIYVKHPATGKLEVLLLKMPRDDGAHFPVRFAAGEGGEAATPPLRPHEIRELLEGYRDSQAAIARLEAEVRQLRSGAATPGSLVAPPASRVAPPAPRPPVAAARAPAPPAPPAPALGDAPAPGDAPPAPADLVAMARGESGSGGSGSAAEAAALDLVGDLEVEEAEDEGGLPSGIEKLQVYGYLDGEYSGGDGPNDRGSFDLHHYYIGLAGPVSDGWTARAEFELEHGFTSDSGGTRGEAKLDRGYLRKEFDSVNVTVGKIFNPFGFFSPVHQEVFQWTTQDPFQFKRIFPAHQTGVTADGSFGGRHHWRLGYYNGEGTRPDEVDDNDNKGLLFGYENSDFLRGRFGFAAEHGRDGNQGDRRERKYILSLEQDFGRLHLRSEYAWERANGIGGIRDNDSWYADLRYDLTRKLSTTLRWDTITHDTRGPAVGFRTNRRLFNLAYILSPVLRFKFDAYHDSFGGPGGGALSRTGYDLAIAAAFGL